MSGDVHVRFCESLRGWFPWATQLVVDIEKIQKISGEGVNGIFKKYVETMEKEIINPLTSDVNEFFSKLREIIEKVSGDLQQGIRDKKNKEGAELDALKECLDQFSSGVPAIKKDSEALSHDVDNLKGVKVTA